MMSIETANLLIAITIFLIVVAYFLGVSRE